MTNDIVQMFQERQHTDSAKSDAIDEEIARVAGCSVSEVKLVLSAMATFGADLVDWRVHRARQQWVRVHNAEAGRRSGRRRGP